MLRKEEEIVQQVMREFAGKNASMENNIHKLDFPMVANEIVNRLENLIRQGAVQPMQTAGRFALKDKKRFEFHCIAKDEKEFNDKIQTAYNNRSGLKPKGTTYTIEDYLADFIKVKVTIEKL